MINKTIEMIYQQSKGYKKHTNEWNIANQLIDIIAVSDEQTAEIVLRDLAIEDMGVKALTSKITGQRLADPVEVMKSICEFYGIEAPTELPPEHWRSTQSQTSAPKPSAPKFSLIDFM